MQPYVLLSMNAALLDCVTSDLRGVTVAFSGDVENGSVDARFLYEGAVGELQAECTALAETYVIADFGVGASIAFSPVPHAQLDTLPGEMWVFRRWEPET